MRAEPASAAAGDQSAAFQIMCGEIDLPLHLVALGRSLTGRYADQTRRECVD
jgi:hypothetical protein